LVDTSRSERCSRNLSQKGNKIFWDIEPFVTQKQLRTLRGIVTPSFLGSCSPDESFDYQSTRRNFPLDKNSRNAAVRTSNFAVTDNTSIRRREENQLNVTECFIAHIICSTCFGHLYAHHQELETILVLLRHMVCNALVAGVRLLGVEQQVTRPE